MRSNELTAMQKTVRSIAIGVSGGVATTIILLIILSAVLSFNSVPQSFINPMSIAAITIGSFISGYICAKLKKEKGMFYGLICGCVIFIIILIASLTISYSGIGALIWIKLAMIILSSMLGGVLGVNSRKKFK